MQVFLAYYEVLPVCFIIYNDSLLYILVNIEFICTKTLDFTSMVCTPQINLIYINKLCSLTSSMLSW